VRKISPEVFSNSLQAFYEDENFYKEKMQVCFYNVNDVESEPFCQLCEMICQKDLFKNVRILDRADDEVFNSEAAKELDIIFEQDIRNFPNLNNQANIDIIDLEESSNSNEMEGDSDGMSGLLDESLSGSLEDIEEDI